MTNDEFNALKSGDAIRIRFGGGGATQFAVVHSWTRSGNCRVMKFSATRDIWKGPLRVAAGEVIALATEEDRSRRRAPRPFPETGRSYPRNPLAPRS